MKRNATIPQGAYWRFLLLLCLLCISGRSALHAQPINPSFTVDKTSGCAPLTVTFTDTSPNTVTTWAWDIDNDGTFDYTTQNPSHTYTTPGVYSVRLYVTDAPGTNTGSVVNTMLITVAQPPTADAGTSGMAGTTGLVIGGAPSASNGTAPYTYSWSPATGLDNPAIANPTALPSSNTTYTLTVTDASGCQDTSSVTVVANPLVADAGPDLVICPGFAIWIGASTPASGGLPPYSYQWSPTAGLSIPTAPNTDGFPSATTIYTLTVTDALGNTSVDTMKLTVGTPPVVNAGPDKTICFGGTAQLGGSPSASGPDSLYYQYAWTPQAGLNDSTSANPTASPTTTTTYYLRVFGRDICDRYDTVVVTVTPPPSPKISPAGPIDLCQGGSTTLSVPGSFSSYRWSTGDTTPTITVNSAGSYYVLVVGAGGCPGSSDTVAVNIVPTPTPKLTANGPTTFCQGDSVTISAPSGFVSYLWSNGQTTESITVKSAGTYYATVTNSTGCSGVSDSMTVKVNPLPTAKLTANGPTTFCQGDSVRLTAPAGFKSYLWSNGMTTPSIMVKDSGMYFVTVTNANDCRANSDTMKVTTNPLPAPKLSAGGPTDFCKGGSVTLTAPAGYTSYLWSNGKTSPTITVSDSGKYSVLVTNSNGCKGRSDTISVTVYALPKPKLTANGSTTFCVGDSVQISAPAGFKAYLWSTGETTPSIFAKTAGNYSVVVTNNTDCQGPSDTITVKTNPLPVAKLLVGGPTTFCEGGSVRLTAPLGFRKYRWSTGDTTLSIMVKQSGNYNVVVTNATGCSNSSDTVSVTVNPLPTPTLSANGPTEFCAGDSVQLDAPAGYKAYRWSTGDTTQSIMVRTTGNYSVLVTNSTDCKGRSDTVAVTVHTLPTPKLTTSGPTTFCQGESIVLTAPAGFDNYLWNTGDVTPSITVSDSGRYYVMVSTPFGCVGSSDTITTKINPLPAPKLTVAGVKEFCEGDSVKLSAPTGFKAYLWSNGETTRSIVAKIAGDYSVMVTNNNGCVGSSDTVTVTTYALPTATLIPSGPTEFCQGDSVQLDAPLGYAKYRWSTGDTTLSIIVKKSGRYSVLMTNDNDCVGSSDTIDVSVNPIPVPKVTTKGQPKLCYGDSLELMAPEGYTGYLWSTGETTRTIFVMQTGNFAVQVVDSTGCVGVSDSITVSVADSIATPVISLNGPATFCQGDSTKLSVAAGYATYRWSTGDTTNSIMVTKTGSYSVMVTNADGCVKVADSVQVTVHPTPQPEILLSGSQQLCNGDTLTLSAPKGFVRYEWSTGDSTREITVATGGVYSVGVLDSNGCYGMSKDVKITLNTPPTPKLTVVGKTTVCDGQSVVLQAPKGFASYLWSNGATERVITVDSTGMYSVMVTDTVGCHGLSDTINVTVHPAVMPEITAVGSARVCDGDSVTLEASAGFARYHWSTGDTTRTIVVTKSGSYTVDVVDTNGCVGTVVEAFEVNVAAPVVATIDGPESVCRDTKGVFSVPADSGRVYRWEIAGALGIITAGQGTPSITVRWADSGSSTVSVVVSDTNSNCAANASLNVQIGEPFTPVIAGSTTMCAGDSMLLDAGAGYAKYLWSNGDTTQTITVWNKGKYSVTVENKGGCVATASFSVDRIFAAPQPRFNMTGTAKYPGDTLLLTVIPDGYLRYSWHKNDEWLTKDTTRSLVVRENGIYSVEVTDSNGCHGIAEVVIDMWKTPITMVSLPKMQAAPGDTITVPLQLYWENLDPTEIRPYTATLRFNKSLLMPVDTTPRGVIDGDERVIMIDGLHKISTDDTSQTSTLTSMRFLVMLGDDESTPLKIESFQWADTLIKLTRKEDGVLYILKLCREGGTRLFDGNGELALKQNRPNPANGVTEIEYSTREQGRVRLTITDLGGKVISTLVDENMEPGDYVVAFDASDLPTGVYVCRLITETGVRSRLIHVRN